MARFGFDEVGETNIWTAERIAGSYFFIPEDGKAESISVHVYSTKSGIRARCAIYERTRAPLPLLPQLYKSKNLVGATPSQRISSGWNTFEFKDGPDLKGLFGYYLVVMTSGYAYISCDKVRRRKKGAFRNLGYPGRRYEEGFPDQWDIQRYQKLKYSIYCAYTPTR